MIRNNLKILILSFQIIAKEEEVRIWYQNGKITEVGITIEEIVDLRNIKIDENNKVEIEMKNYKFFVDKSDLIQEHNNNKENIRNKVPKLSSLGGKIDKKQLKDIDFRETLFSLIKNKKVIIYDKTKKKNLQEVAICSGYSEETNQKRQDFSGVIYEKLIYSVDLKDKIIIPDWRFHYSGVVNNKPKDNTKRSEKSDNVKKFKEEAIKNPGKEFRFHVTK